MTWLFTLLAVAVVALAAGLVTGRLSGGMDPAPSSSPFRGLPADAVAPADLEALRFTPVLRGYRMDEVDQVLDRITAELRRRDEELAALRAAVGGPRRPGADLPDAGAPATDLPDAGAPVVEAAPSGVPDVEAAPTGVPEAPAGPAAAADARPDPVDAGAGTPDPAGTDEQLPSAPPGRV